MLAHFVTFLATWDAIKSSLNIVFSHLWVSGSRKALLVY